MFLFFYNFIFKPTIKNGLFSRWIVLLGHSHSHAGWTSCLFYDPCQSVCHKILFFSISFNFFFLNAHTHTYTHFRHSLGFWWDWKVFSVSLSETGQLSFILKWSVVVSTALRLGAFEWAWFSELSPLPADSCLGTDFSWTSHKVCFCLDWICPTFLLDVDLSLRVPHGMVLVFQMLDI